MFSTSALRQAAAHAERTPLIKFIGRRSTPAAIDHSPHPHPASPTGKLPQDFASSHEASSRHTTFSTYRDNAQQFGPLRKTIRSGEGGIGGTAGASLGPVAAPKGVFFDRAELPAQFRRTPVELSEIEAVESGGAALFR